MGIYGTHLCGDYYKKDEHCEHILYATPNNNEHKGKRLNLYYVYCTAENRCRSLGCSASFTGNSPTWCPKRRAKHTADEHEVVVNIHDIVT